MAAFSRSGEPCRRVCSSSGTHFLPYHNMISMTKLFCMTGLLLFTAILLSNTASAAETGKIVSYIRTWPIGSTPEDMAQGVYWTADDINGDKLSTLNIAFAHITDGTDIYIKDIEEGPEGKPGFTNLFEEIAKVKAASPDLRINLSIGGWGADGFSDMAVAPESRQAFIENVMTWLKKYDFDGVDIDWEYPVSGAWGTIKSRPEDKENFTLLLTELRDMLNSLGEETNKTYELSFAANIGPDFLTWIEPEKVAAVVDYAKLMSYDLYGGWSATTGHQANLYPSAKKPEDLSIDQAVQNFLNAGFPAEKLLLGVPFYGRGWKGVPDTDNGLYQTPGEATFPDGITYPDIVKLIEAEGLQRYWDDDAKVPYLYNGDIWITYEDEQSLQEKAKYVKEKGLRGIMIWEYAHDMDNTLLDALNDALK